MKNAAFLLAGALLASCSTAPASSQNGRDNAMAADEPATPSSDCPVTASSAWAAWVNGMPGPESRPSLIVTGKATVPTGGYSFGWGDPIVAESSPVQVTVQLKPVPPAGPATQAVTTMDVRGSWPMGEAVGSVTIKCGTTVLARIAPVETVY